MRSPPGPGDGRASHGGPPAGGLWRPNRPADVGQAPQEPEAVPVSWTRGQKRPSEFPDDVVTLKASERKWPLCLMFKSTSTPLCFPVLGILAVPSSGNHPFRPGPGVTISTRWSSSWVSRIYEFMDAGLKGPSERLSAAGGTGRAGLRSPAAFRGWSGDLSPPGGRRSDSPPPGLGWPSPNRSSFPGSIVVLRGMGSTRRQRRRFGGRWVTGRGRDVEMPGNGRGDVHLAGGIGCIRTPSAVPRAGSGAAPASAARSTRACVGACDSMI